MMTPFERAQYIAYLDAVKKTSDEHARLQILTAEIETQTKLLIQSLIAREPPK